jgi:hypothetical protein
MAGFGSSLTSSVKKSCKLRVIGNNTVGKAILERVPASSYILRLEGKD